MTLIGVLCMLASMIVSDKAGRDAKGSEVVQILSKPKYLDMGSIGQPAPGRRLQASMGGQSL